MPDIYVMNDAISMAIVLFLIGTAICVGFVSLIELAIRREK